MVEPITFLCNSLGAADFIKVYVFLYTSPCNSNNLRKGYYCAKVGE